jgi:cell division protein FtsQ
MTRRIRWALWIAAAMLVIAGAIMLPRGARRLAFFRLRQVEVVGSRYLDATEVVRQLGLRPDASTLDPVGPIRKAAFAIRGVMGVTVERRLPGTLRVTLREAVPVALAPGADRLVLIDSRGQTLPYDPARAPASLPIATRDSVTAGLLQRLMQTDPVWYDSIESARSDRGDVVLDAGMHHIRLRPDADDEVLRAVAAVREYLRQTGIGWREIDGRFRERVFVRKSGA